MDGLGWMDFGLDWLSQEHSCEEEKCSWAKASQFLQISFKKKKNLDFYVLLYF